MKIYLDRLKEGEEHPLVFEMKLQELDLVFEGSVSVVGKAIKTDGELILQMTIQAILLAPCVICNENVRVPITAKTSQAIPVKEIRGAVLECEPLFREWLLLELPTRAECEPICPKRQEIGQYLKKSGPQVQTLGALFEGEI